MSIVVIVRLDTGLEDKIAHFSVSQTVANMSEAATSFFPFLLKAMTGGASALVEGITKIFRSLPLFASQTQTELSR